MEEGERWGKLQKQRGKKMEDRGQERERERLRGQIELDRPWKTV